MNEQKLKEIIRMTQNAVQDIDDKDTRLKTYELIINNLLNQEKKVHSTEQKEKIKEIIIESDNAIDRLSKKLNIDKDVIDDFIEFNGAEITLLFPIKRYSNREKHLIFALIYLTIKKICFEEKEIESSLLRELMANKGLSSLVNLSTNLKKYPSFINHKASKRGSTNTYYKLTIEGLSKGTQVLKELLSDRKQIEEMNIDFLDNKQGSKKRAGRSSALSTEINNLLNNGFFDTFRTVNELVEELKSRGFFNRRQDVDSYVRQSLLGKKLLREKSGNIWRYVLKK